MLRYPVLLFTLAACNGTQSDLTYYEDTKKIIDSRCATCHQAGDFAPFSLSSYDDLVAFQGSVQASIENGTMPPWQPSDGCNDYVGNFDLTAAERETLLAWLDGGMLEGEPASAGPSVPDAPSWDATVTLRIPEPYTPVGEPDDYRCHLIPWPEDETVHVTGFRVVPDKRDIVHHTIAFLVGPEDAAAFQAYDAAEEGPGYTCFGGPTPGTENPFEQLDPATVAAALAELGLSPSDVRSGNLTSEELAALVSALGIESIAGGFSTLVGTWTPGAEPLPLPEGTGIKVEPGSLIVAQMHYNTQSANPVADQSTLEIAFTNTVDRPATNLLGIDLGWVSNGRIGGEAMTIPAGNSDVSHSTTISHDSLFTRMALDTLGLQRDEPLVIHWANHHMHELGISQTSVLMREDGSQTCLLDIPDWDFQWQGAYQLKEPVVLRPGDTIEVTCTWDNSAANQPVVNGEVREPVDVAWGEGTADEMCLAGFYVTAQQ